MMGVQIEQASRSVIFDAVVYLFQVRRRVLNVISELEVEPRFLQWEAAWGERFPDTPPARTFFQAAGDAYAIGMFERLADFESRSQLMSRLIAALILNPRRQTDIVLQLASDAPIVAQWRESAVEWIRETMLREGGNANPIAPTVPLVADEWGVGVVDIVPGDELDAFDRGRFSLHVGAKADIGEWWEGQAGSYPGLCATARRLCAMPISSTILERLFSRARSVLDYTMGASNPETIRKRLVLYLNREVTEFVLSEHPEVHKAGRLLIDDFL
jgi:hypothetical protein